MGALLLGPVEKERLAALAEIAFKNPVSMAQLIGTNSKSGKRKHMDQMSRQTIDIPINHVVTFSVENQTRGQFRHMSVSIDRKGKTPSPEAVWIIAELLGFTGSYKDCMVYPEKLLGSAGVAMNVMQPVGELRGD